MPSPRPAPSCPRTCGDVEIPYPFGISDACVWPGPDDFTITCNHSFNPPRPFIMDDIEIININVVDGYMTVFTIVSSHCYTSSNTVQFDGLDWDVTDSPFLFSATQNEFTAIGCNKLALLFGKEDVSYFTGCVTSCMKDKTEGLPHDGEKCSGLGCCQITILSNLSTILVNWSYGNGTTPYYPGWIIPCTYAFLAERNWYGCQLYN